MTHSLVLEVPDEIYQQLADRAEKEEKTVEQIALEILEKAVYNSKDEKA